MALSESPQGGDISSAPLAAAAPFSNPRDQVASGFDALLLLVMILSALILACTGGRLAVRRRRRHRRWRLEAAEWQAAFRQIQLERAPGATRPSERLQRFEVGSDFVLRKARSAGGASQDPRPAKKKKKPAKAK